MLLRIYIAYFLLGYSSLIGQTVLLREFLVISFGNEASVGLLLAAWLFWIAVGAEVGGRMAPRTRDPRSLFTFLLLLCALTLPAEVCAFRYMRVALQIPGGEIIPTVLAALYTGFVVAPFSFLQGNLFPLGMRLLPDISPGTPAPFGRVWAAEALGALIGGIAFTVIIAGRLSSLHSVGMVAVVLVAAAEIINFSTGGCSRKVKRCLDVCSFMLIVSVVLSAGKVEKRTMHDRWESYGSYTDLLTSVDSRYQNIAISRRDDQHSLFLNGLYAESFPDDYLPELNARMALAQSEEAGDVLLIGGGITGMVRQIQGMGARSIDCVLLDPRVVASVRPYLDPDDAAALDADNVRLHLVDARRFINSATRSYDTIFLGVSDPSTAMLNRFYTVDFFRGVKRLLRPRGVFVFTLTGSEIYLGDELADYVRSIYFSLRAVFPDVFVCPQETMYFYATTQRGLLSGDAQTLVKRWQMHDRAADAMTADIYRSFFLPGRYERLRLRLEENASVPLNTDMHPNAYFYFTRFSARMLNFRFSRGLRYISESESTPRALRTPARLLARPARWMEQQWSPVGERLRGIGIRSVYAFIAIIAILVTIPLVFHRRASGRLRGNVVLYTALASGFTGMSLEMILLIAFQSSFGYLFHAVGLMMGLFMFGIVIGSLSSDRGRSRVISVGPGSGVNDAALLSGFVLGLTALSALTPLVLPHLASPRSLTAAGYGLMMIVNGLLVGALLPLTTHALRETVMDPSRALGQVDRADHLGACLGALLGVTWLIPRFGIVQTCLVMAALNLAGLLWVLAIRLRFR
ncbi:MAG: hypothetical protein AUJ92_01160 [Armatimonadetes bacterium CG2_30_59_28]|nr:hypothetical protein [Armatimonadota bacterium]OIO98581.1 MAG: hypothetical protein AUJ92_01160 [Armatimonadetes bacterium CG2_30_59_28]PIU64957.1 MAG: hypothetical protein COS85_10545 [Armatimonadetes bacterium CG07_land_8_20_14_0_80_59_28]PIX41670.1 MAG: hypothetical protein COZ56_11310 [Armatimonadetes bacterium CG_4_8_14_3_um_filter_58_9]PIY41455.1 MAG: hypothetical protein COZ05_15660 [Armatimonadetes bacterium CG_4_10_14_3_um_filter_59_10]